MFLNDIIRIVDESRTNGLSNYIVPGLNSYLVGDGKDAGKVRLFHAERQTRDTITPHSHRFDFACLVLRGSVWNTLYEPPNPGTRADLISDWCVSTIDQVCGVDGIRQYVHVREKTPIRLASRTKEYVEGQTYSMKSDEIHSIVFSGNARVLFFEGPAKTARSVMIEPWVNGKLVPTFETKDWMFEKLP